MLERINAMLRGTATVGEILEVRDKEMVVATSSGPRTVQRLADAQAGDRVAISGTTVSLNHSRRGLTKYEV